ncbi:MAG: hypothetical protein IKC45_04430 [Clostridia bacterium]|nr:hypothetical protein [Clostridia bacterium]
MENLRIWTFSLCGALFITAIFKIIVSGSRLEKSVNIFLSVFIFLYAVFPVNDTNFNVDSYIDIDDNNTDVIYYNGYEKIIKESIKKICSDNNIDINSINIDSYIDDNGDYVVNKIIIESNTSDNKNNIKSIIKSELGFEVKVI